MCIVPPYECTIVLPKRMYYHPIYHYEYTLLSAKFKRFYSQQQNPLTMIHQGLNFTITEYTNFRQLEFEFSKLQDENLQNKSKLIALETMYQECWNQLQLLRQKDCQLDAVSDRQYTKLTDEVCRLNLQLGEQKQKYHLEIQRNKQLEKYNKKHQKELEHELSYLTTEHHKLQQESSELLTQLHQTKRENSEYKLKMSQFTKAETLRNTIPEQPQEQLIEDNNFALDLLHYQKQLLQRVFGKVLNTFKSENIVGILEQIYGCYEAVTETYRQKLQIEYDLEDLQREYKRELSSKVDDQLLIELRKQVETFRTELYSQKESLTKTELQLENSILNLQVAEQEDYQTRNYSQQIEKKLRNMKKTTTSNTMEDPQETVSQMQTRIRFRPSNQEEKFMKEVIEKDRDNIEKIFRQSRTRCLKGSY